MQDFLEDLIAEFTLKYGELRLAPTVKRLPEMLETRVQFLGWEDPLEKEMAVQSSILAWKVPWMVEPSRLLSMGSQISA